MAISDLSVFLNTTGIADISAAMDAVRKLGFRSIQFGKLQERYYSAAGAVELAELLDKHGLQAKALCAVYEGESYADVESVRATVGFLPPETSDARVAFSHKCVDLAAALHIPLVTTHMGFLPTDHNDPGYRRVFAAVGRAAAYARDCGVQFALETGQETEEELLDFIARLDAPVGVNFDGANFIAYDMAYPLHALELLYPKILGVHLKDYTPPRAPGLLGNSCRLGQGHAQVDETLRYLQSAGFSGPLILETYSDTDQLQTLAFSRAYVLQRLKLPV